jgi:hypothetical protein
MGGYTRNIDDLLTAGDEVTEWLFAEGRNEFSDTVEELVARLRNIAPHIDANRLQGPPRHTLRTEAAPPLSAPCEHDWRRVVDVCKNMPCTGRVLGRRCAKCDEFDGTWRPHDEG